MTLNPLTASGTSNPAPASPVNGTPRTTRALRADWQALKLQNPDIRARDAAQKLGVTEAELLAYGCAAKVVRLRPDWGHLFRSLEPVGEMMALTRNDDCVIERHGVYRQTSWGTHNGLVLDEGIDLRMFPRHWASVFAVTEDTRSGPRHSLQFFDPHGVAVHKAYLVEGSVRAAFDTVVAAFADPDQAAPFSVAAAPAPTPDKPDAEIDATAFLGGWAALEDTHDFYPLLRRHGVARTQALRLAQGRFAWKIPTDGLTRAIARAAETQLDIMFFVGNPGCIEIHTGPVNKLVRTGPWFNVLDPKLNLHLRDDRIASAFVVRKPTRDGVVTSIEAFDGAGENIIMMFGRRKPGVPELDGWRALVSDVTGVPRG